MAYADVPKGGTLAVLGLGPIGQMAARIARHLGVERVIGVDLCPSGWQLAPRVGHRGRSTCNDVDDVAAALIELTGGRGPDAVIEAVGMEAHGSPRGKLAHAAVGLLPDALARPMIDKMAIDRLDALHTAVKSVRRGGTVSVSGVYGGEMDPMPMMEMFDRGIQLRMGQCHVHRWTRRHPAGGRPPTATRSGSSRSPPTGCRSRTRPRRTRCSRRRRTAA